MEAHVPTSFEVTEIIPFKAGFILAGKAFGGKITVGDVFNKVVRVSQSSDEKAAGQTRRETLAAIKLEVLGIEYFRQSVGELGKDHAGGLYVRGEGIEYVQMKCNVEISRVHDSKRSAS